MHTRGSLLLILWISGTDSAPELNLPPKPAGPPSSGRDIQKSTGWCQDMKGEYQWSYYSVDGSFASGQACAKLVEKTPENKGAIFNPTSGQCYRLTGDVYAGGPDYTDHECYAFRDPNAAPITTTTPVPIVKSFDKFDGWCQDSKGEYQWSYYSVKGDFTSGEDCAKAAMQKKKAKGATFDTSSKNCFYLSDEVAKGGSDYPGYQCFVFKDGAPEPKPNGPPVGPPTGQQEINPAALISTTPKSGPPSAARDVQKSTGWCQDMNGEYQWSYYSVDGSFTSGEECAKLVERTPENKGAIFNPTSGQCYRLTGDVYAGGPDYTDHECYAFRDPNAAPITTTTPVPVVKSFDKFDGWCQDSKGEYQWSYYSVKGDFTSGEDCAKAAMQKKKAKGATFDTSSKNCFYLSDEVAKGGSDYPGYQCFVFKNGPPAGPPAGPPGGNPAALISTTPRSGPPSNGRVVQKSTGWCQDMNGEYQWSYYKVDGSFRSGEECAKLVEKTPENTGAIFNPTSGLCYKLTGDVYAGGPDYTDHECYAFRDPNAAPITTTTPVPVMKSFDKFSGWCKDSKGEYQWSYYTVKGDFASGEDCAKAAMQKKAAKGATFSESSGACFFLSEEVVEGGSDYPGYQCFVFKNGPPGVNPGQLISTTRRPGPPSNGRVFQKSTGWCQALDGSYQWSYNTVPGTFNSGEACAKEVLKTLDSKGAVFFPSGGECYRMNGEVSEGGPDYANYECYAFRDPNAAPITTTTLAPVVKSFEKFPGWCMDSNGEYSWDYYTVKGDFTSGEDCAQAAMQKKNAKGATFSVNTGQCFYLYKEVAKGGSEDDYPGYQCFVFTDGPPGINPGALVSTTPRSGPPSSGRVFQKSTGWCQDLNGEYQWSYYDVTGAFESGEACAKLVMKTIDSKGAVFLPSTGQCYRMQGEVYAGGPDYADYECFAFRDPNAAPITTTTVAPVRKSFTKFDGWCADSKGDYQWSYYTVKGDFSSGEDCANAAMQKKKAKGATFSTSTGQCFYLMDEVAKGGSDYPGYQCFVFKAGPPGPSNGAMLTTPASPGDRVFQKSSGWCVDFSGDYQWSYFDVQGKFKTGEECARLVIDEVATKGITYQASSGECYKLTEEVAGGGPEYKDYDCFVFRDPNAPPMTTTTSAPVVKKYDTTDGWCANSKGKYSWSYYPVAGDFDNGDECAMAAMQRKLAKAAVYHTENGKCYYISEEVVRGDDTSYKNYKCFVFKV